MLHAPDFDPVGPNLFIWQFYDPAVKADLFSTALGLPAGTFLFDPILLEEAPLARLLGEAPIAGIVLTNANHLRASDAYARRFSVPIFAHPEVAPHLPGSTTIEITDGSVIGEELRVITLEGGGGGELALHHPSDGGTLIIGDALIHFDPYGFTTLPDKYCDDSKQLGQSLQKLARYDVAKIFFAHGLPILSKAQARLSALLHTTLTGTGS